LGAFAALWVTGTRVARRARDRFDLLCAFGMVTLLTVPALLNACVVMGLVPTKGLTLPFLSYGRTSLVMSCVALGILLGVARRHPPHPTNPLHSQHRTSEAKWQGAG
jgi:cell division protein FtsW